MVHSGGGTGNSISGIAEEIMQDGDEIIKFSYLERIPEWEETVL